MQDLHNCCTTVAALISILFKLAANDGVPSPCFVFYCMFYFTCDRSLAESHSTELKSAAKRTAIAYRSVASCMLPTIIIAALMVTLRFDSDHGMRYT